MASCWLNRGCFTSEGLREPHALLSYRPLAAPHTSRTSRVPSVLPSTQPGQRPDPVPNPPPCAGPAGAQPHWQERAVSVRCFGLIKKRKKSGISQQTRNKIQFRLPHSVTEGGLSICWRKQKGSCTPRISQTTARGVIYRRSCMMINQALVWLLINLPL